MTKPEIECCHTRKCKWKGKWSDLVPVPSKDNSGPLDVDENTCPKCGGKEFYRIEQEPSHD